MSTSADLSAIAKTDGGFSFTGVVADILNNDAYRQGFVQMMSGQDSSSAYVWNLLSAIADDVGKTTYEKILNYIDNISNVDLCQINALQSMIQMLGVDYTVFNQYTLMPDEIQRLMDILSIKREYLLDNTKVTDALASYLSSNISAESGNSELDARNRAYNVKITGSDVTGTDSSSLIATYRSSDSSRNVISVDGLSMTINQEFTGDSNQRILDVILNSELLNLTQYHAYIIVDQTGKAIAMLSPDEFDSMHDKILDNTESVLKTLRPESIKHLDGSLSSTVVQEYAQFADLPITYDDNHDYSITYLSARDASKCGYYLIHPQLDRVNQFRISSLSDLVYDNLIECKCVHHESNPSQMYLISRFKTPTESSRFKITSLLITKDAAGNESLIDHPIQNADGMETSDLNRLLRCQILDIQFIERSNEYESGLPLPIFIAMNASEIGFVQYIGADDKLHNIRGAGFDQVKVAGSVYVQTYADHLFIASNQAWTDYAKNDVYCINMSKLAQNPTASTYGSKISVQKQIEIEVDGGSQQLDKPTTNAIKLMKYTDTASSVDGLRMCMIENYVAADSSHALVIAVYDIKPENANLVRELDDSQIITYRVLDRLLDNKAINTFDYDQASYVIIGAEYTINSRKTGVEIKDIMTHDGRLMVINLQTGITIAHNENGSTYVLDKLDNDSQHDFAWTRIPVLDNTVDQAIFQTNCDTYDMFVTQSDNKFMLYALPQASQVQDIRQVAEFSKEKYSSVRIEVGYTQTYANDVAMNPTMYIIAQEDAQISHYHIFEMTQGFQLSELYSSRLQQGYVYEPSHASSVFQSAPLALLEAAKFAAV